jgi:FtsP/CotA-like multicopper oxidase with cupredoxin domain
MTTKNKYFELTASEFKWKLSGEKTIEAWGFNESVPGPVLRANKGDTVIVKVKNNLKEPTTIHWHGIRLPAAMDGTDDVQKPILPGEEFEYRFQVPDAGTFWYHSHVNETVQIERGMHGALIVSDDLDPVVDHERVLLIDDMKLTKQNSFKKGNLVSRWMERHDGREGETLLINGEEGFTIDMHAGQFERWRIINASSARYFRLYLGGQEFRIIGTDGGLIEKAHTATEILLTPGERIDIIVGGFTEGEDFAIESLPYNRMTFLRAKRQVFGTVRVQKSKPSIAFIPEKLRIIEPLASQDANAMRKITFSVEPSLKHGIDFKVNKQVHAMDKPVNVGELQVWEIQNTSLMDHPYHLHGFFFQVLEENGKAPAYRAWKDTINIKPRSKVKIAWVPDNRPGNWMHHCHILEHHAAGMMAHFQVVDPMRPNLTQKHHAHAHHH